MDSACLTRAPSDSDASVRDHSLRNPGLQLHWQEIQKMMLEQCVKAQLCRVSNTMLRNVGLFSVETTLWEAFEPAAQRGY